MKIISLLLLTFLISNTVTKQYLEDYSRIVTSYTDKKNLSFTVTYKSFDTNAKIADTVLQGRFEFKGKLFHSKLAGGETIRNDQYYLSIDHMNKIMFLSSVKGMAANFYPIGSVDTALNRQKLRVEKRDIQESHSRVYTIYYPAEDVRYKSVSMEFDTESYLVKKVSMKVYPPENVYELKDWKYLEEPFIEMVYQNYNTSEIDEHTFSLDKFLTINRGYDAQLKGAYKSYQLVNSISLSKNMN